jgi:phosphopantothenoylcysteine decarboxylase/phosphopantothenate--cysteine ligase
LVQGTIKLPPLELVQNPDVLAGLVADPPRADGRRQVVVGFAAETGDDTGGVLDHGRAKARRKGADLLAVNAVGAGLGFGAEHNAVTVLDRDGEVVATAEGSKDAVSDGLWDAVVRVLPR